MVCRRWKDLCHDTPSNRHFWIVRTGLFLDFGHEKGRKQLAHELAKFRSQLMDAHGSDIFITFHFAGTLGWQDYATKRGHQTADSDILLRLLVRGMHFIIPVLPWITSLKLRYPDVRLCKAFLDLLTCHAFPSLRELDIDSESKSGDRLGASSLVDIWRTAWRPESSLLSTIRKKERTRKKPEPAPLSLVHLNHLNTLTVNRAQWFGGIALPASVINRVVFRQHMQDTPAHPLNALASSPNTWNLLTQLQIKSFDMMVGQPHSQFLPLQGLTSNVVLLPNLQSLILSATDTWTAAFLSHVSFPLLVDVILRLVENVISDPPPVYTTTDPGLTMPRVQSLSIGSSRMTLAWNYILRMFAHSPVQFLVFKRAVFGSTVSSDSDPDIHQLLSEMLSHLHPRSVIIKGQLAAAKSLQFILSSLSKDALELLEIEMYESVDSFLPTPSRFSFPGLTTLNVTTLQDSNNLECLLASIEATSLREVSIDSTGIVPDDAFIGLMEEEEGNDEPTRAWDKRGELPLPLFPSVVRVNYTFSVMSREHLDGFMWRVVPHTRELDITISSFAAQDVLTDPDALEIICKSLTPEDDGPLPLPFLESISVKSKSVALSKVVDENAASRRLEELARIRSIRGSTLRYSVKAIHPFLKNGNRRAIG